MSSTGNLPPAESTANEGFRPLFERSTDPIFLFDPAQGVFVDANEAAIRLLACETKQQVLNRRPSDWSPLLQPDGTPSADAAVAMTLETERRGGHRFEWVALRVTGEEVPLEIVATPIHLGGHPLHVVVARDITERKRVEAALRESQALLSSIADNIAEAIYRSDAHHRLIFVNQAYLRLFRYESLADLQSVPREKLYAQPADRQRLLQLLTHDGAFAQQEVEYVRKDGTRFWGQSSSRVIRNPATGSIAYHVGAISDITERRQAADEIQRLNATLERRIAERTAELSASEARLRILVEHAPEAIVVYDGDTGRFVTCNDNAVRLFGRTRAELSALTPLDVSPLRQPDGQASADLAPVRIREALAGGTPAFEWVHLHASGREVPCEVRLVRLPADGRNLLRGSITDTTERRRRERIQQATFQISEAVHTAGDLDHLYERIHRIVDGLMPASNFYIALLHSDGETISFPYYRDEFAKTPAPRQITTGLTGVVIRTGQALLVDEALTARKQRIGDGPEVTFDGQEHLRHVESGRQASIWLGVPLKVEERILGAMAVQDYHNPRAYGEEEKQVLTYVATQIAVAIQRKQSEQALRDSEQKFRALFEATSQGVMLHDTDQFIEVNPAAIRIMGYSSADDIVGRHPKDTSPPTQPDGRNSADAARAYIAECMERGTARFDWVSRTAAGQDIPLEVILTRITTGGRQIIQAVINDISERKRAEAEILRALERERELGVLKSNFVSMVSHEFRTPLSIIMSSAGILSNYFDRLPPRERKEHLDSIQRGIRRMADMMEEVLLLARLDADRLQYHPTPLDLRAFLGIIVDDVLSATDRRCPVEVVFGDVPDRILGDENLLRHVFTNLLTNAIKYSEPGSPVHFDVGSEAGNAVCRIRDHGIGIPNDDLAWLFQAFHRGGNVGRRQGTGLGLVIVKRCLDIHGGTIHLDTELGAGTTVTVRFPVALTAPQKPGILPSRASES
ncbi:MAG: PAS domain S-box protein [Verrucomicrobiales bacterium]|nr:PAS domain S-box protein [Verrucomicrobiales bacterium]